MNQLSYTLEENIQIIRMSKSTKFLVLEGPDDISKYENSIRQINPLLDFSLIFLRGRDKVIKLLAQNDLLNFIAVVDRDFYSDNLPNDPRLVILSRYSIENYILSQPLIIALVAKIVKQTEETISDWLVLSEWVNHVFESLKELLVILHFYQTQVETNRKEWNSVDFEYRGSWKICNEKVSNFVRWIFDDAIPLSDIENHREFREISSNDFLKYFPGKLLLKSVYLFIIERIKTKSGDRVKPRRIISNEAAFDTFSSSFLIRNPDFLSDINPVLVFLGARLEADLTENQ